MPSGLRTRQDPDRRRGVWTCLDHRQNTDTEDAMTLYMVAQAQILDPGQWERYKEIAAREMARHGGRYLVRGASPEVEEAD
jgi:hypothetical protein